VKMALVKEPSIPAGDGEQRTYDSVVNRMESIIQVLQNRNARLEEVRTRHLGPGSKVDSPQVTSTKTSTDSIKDRMIQCCEEQDILLTEMDFTLSEIETL